MVFDNLVQEARQHPHYRVGLKKLSALWNSKVSTLGEFLGNRASIGTMLSGHRDWEMSIGQVDWTGQWEKPGQ